MSRGWRWLLDDEYWGPPLSASGWLDIAVRGLAPPAAERVRAEHLAHLEDALSAGETEAGVVAGWGDPRAARRTLRRVHPTRLEAGLLPPPYGPGLDGLATSLRDMAVVFVVGLPQFIQGVVTLWHAAPAGEHPPLALAQISLVSSGVVLAVLRWAILHRPRSLPMTAALHWGMGPIGAVLASLPLWEWVQRDGPYPLGPGFWLFLLGLLFFPIKAVAVARKVAQSQS